MEENIINKIIENKIRTLLETISKKYPIKFKKENIDKELEYIIKYIIIKNNNSIEQEHQLESKHSKSKSIKKHKKTNIENNIENDTTRCSGRCWSKYIYNKKTMTKITTIDNIFKVTDFKDININIFNKKYILGMQCKKSKSKDSEYCNLHSHHLIHGNYKAIPSKEICYHFMKDGKYL